MICQSWIFKVKDFAERVPNPAIRLILFALSFFLISAASAPEARAVVVAGMTFEDNAFSDNATHVSGAINYLGFSKDGLLITGDNDVDLDTALNGPDLYAHIEGLIVAGAKSAYVVDIDFIDNVLFNGAGYDLAVFERGQPEAVGVSLYDPRFNSFTSALYFATENIASLPDSVDVSPGVNIARIDFASWGIPDGLEINKIRLFGGSGGDPSADVAAIGGVNTRDAASANIPEPTTFLMFMVGLGAFYRSKSRKL